jgi:hypothetical protein
LSTKTQSFAGPVDVTPSASSLSSSLRDIGYDFPAAMADLVDNSISAGATRVDIDVVFDGAASYVVVADDGGGMTESELNEALRFGTRRMYGTSDLGRYGLGLKTASLSQCRRLTVLSRRSSVRRRIATRSLDIDHIISTDRWEILSGTASPTAAGTSDLLRDGPGTVVVWETLDRVLPAGKAEGGWARRRLEQLSERTAGFLGMVFHRFIEGTAARSTRWPVTITVNGRKVPAWSPFAPEEASTEELRTQTFDLDGGPPEGWVQLRRFVLPTREAFSSASEFDRLSGPMKWNRQQGIYIYRADRLLQAGGWCGLRAADEHTKLARAALDFPTSLDGSFQISVAKMRASLPAELRTLLERPINELCRRAQMVYRREAPYRPVDDVPPPLTPPGMPGVGSALVAAALDAGEGEGFTRVMERLRSIDPVTATALGW